MPESRFEEAFNSVNCDFILYIMNCMGFDQRWISWIEQCISTPFFSLLIDGSSHWSVYQPTVAATRDPLYPYLFVLVMEYFTISLEKAIIQDLLTMPKCTGLLISHLIYADAPGVL